MAKGGNLANGEDCRPKDQEAPDTAPAATSRSSCRSWSRSSRPSHPTSSSSSWSSWWSSWRPRRGRLHGDGPGGREENSEAEEHDANEVHGSSLSVMWDGNAKVRGTVPRQSSRDGSPTPYLFGAPVRPAAMTPTKSNLASAAQGAWRRFLETYEPLRSQLYRYCRYLTRSPGTRRIWRRTRWRARS